MHQQNPVVPPESAVHPQKHVSTYSVVFPKPIWFIYTSTHKNSINMLWTHDITRYSSRYKIKDAKTSFRLWLHKDTPYLLLVDELWGVFNEVLFSWERMPPNIESALYILHFYKYIIHIISYMYIGMSYRYHKCVLVCQYQFQRILKGQEYAHRCH